VNYVHVVFTIPHELSWLALRNKKVVYDLLFQFGQGFGDGVHLASEITILWT
jgi:hypothetical protein